MARTIHFGITSKYSHEPVEMRFFPRGFVSDGDSFLCWGDESMYAGDPTDGTLHVTYDAHARKVDAALVDDLLFDLSQVLQGEERLIDYVVITDRDDWAKDQHIYLPDTSMARMTPITFLPDFELTS